MITRFFFFREAVSQPSRFYEYLNTFFILLSTSAFAKVCKKGQPCGNSCISWNKTCRIEQPTLFTHQNQIANNNTGEDVPTGRKIKDSIIIEAEFGCMVTWTALVDFHLFKKNEEEVINDVLYKVKLKARFNNKSIDQNSENELRVVYRNALNKDSIKALELEKMQ